ncbi:MAG TPA: dTDP-glucose 4,6-dehydratase [Bacteroidetes bacterium]|nr:dTDP-glucose 4,6-dehydratase [Bacteroidota bacterium]
MNKTILITGGAGFIGSHVVRHFVKNYPEYRIINLDLLTYAGNLENLKDIEKEKNYLFVRGDIRNRGEMKRLFEEHRPVAVIHLAAESHVDRSISDPTEFISTNVVGTGNLLTLARDYWKGSYEGKVFYHISTDEVFGSLGREGKFREDTPYDPKSPYSASKAGADHLVRAFSHTYGLPALISNCSNNYGPYQFPEKLIPLAIYRIMNGEEIPVYGKGENIRDWLYVEDHARAIDLLFHRGRRGETYNIGGNNEWKNIDLLRLLCRLADERLGNDPGHSEGLIRFVKDRAGHDLRYAIDAEKIRKELGWEPLVSFQEGLAKTLDWYLSHREWLEHVITGEYRQYYNRQYYDRPF